MNIRHVLGVALAFWPLAGFAQSCGDSRLCEGTVVKAENLDRLRDKEFEGHRLGDMLPERIEWQIREGGLSITLAKSRPYPEDSRHSAATERYAADVTLDPKTKLISGWKAGIPFPDVDYRTDPNAALKIIWNLARGRPRGDIIDQPRMAFLLIDQAAGLERVQEWSYIHYGMKGLLRDGTPPVVGDGRVYDRELLFGIAPQDLKGVGTFTIRYDDGAMNDAWAYVRDVRRVRRLSGSAWMEIIGGTDIVGDDFGGFAAHPAWYENYELLGKKTILAVAHSEGPYWDEAAGNPAQTFPKVDLAAAPHWNVKEQWEPREVYIVRATPPQGHVYKHKVLHIDTKAWVNYVSIGTDVSGVHRKTQILGNQVWKPEDRADGVVIYEAFSNNVDFVRKHATVYVTFSSVRFNSNIREEDVNLQRLEALGR